MHLRQGKIFLTVGVEHLRSQIRMMLLTPALLCHKDTAQTEGTQGSKSFGMKCPVFRSVLRAPIIDPFCA